MPVIFSQISDGLLEAHPTPPERLYIQRNNAMGLHDLNARVELAGADIPSTVGELREALFNRLAISRSQRINLYFWGRKLEDDSKTLLEERIVTNSELTLTTSLLAHSELAAMRQLMPLRKVRLTSNKVVPFALANVTRETRTDDLRRAVHAHLHSPVCYFAREDWKPGVDTLIFHRGDQLVKESGGGGKKKKDKGGMSMRNLHNNTSGIVAAADESLVECRIELADVHLFYNGKLMPDDRTLNELGVLHDDIVFLDIRRPLPFDPDPPPLPVKKPKKKAAGKAK